MITDLHTQTLSPEFFQPVLGTQLAWLGMAGVLVNARGTILLIDPIITSREEGDRRINESEYPLKLPNPIEARDVPHADAVCYTHADDDHLGKETARILSERTACRFYAPPPVARLLVECGVPVERISEVHDYDNIPIGMISVTITPALHNWQEVDPWQRGDCCGYLLNTPDGVIWHPGDTRLIDELLVFRGVDVLFFDVAAVEAHLGPEGSAALARSCGARTLIAYHYGTFDLPPGNFASFDPAESLPYLKDLDAKFTILNPGQVLRMPEDLA
jgi:L-ascorbate metabolism protein UlaG (beta-lactamase superfamily)